MGKERQFPSKKQVDEDTNKSMEEIKNGPAKPVEDLLKMIYEDKEASDQA